MARFGQVLAVALVAAGVNAVAADARPPVLSVEPYRGIPGQLVLVSGRGFCGSPECGRVRIQLYGFVVAQRVRVSSSGRFARRIKVPSGPPTGDVGVIATQRVDDGSELQAFTSFEIAVRLRTEQPEMPAPVSEGATTSPSPPAETGPDRSSGPAREPPRPDAAPASADVPRGGPRPQAAGDESSPRTGDGDGGAFALVAGTSALLVLGTVLALVTLWRRRSPRG